MCVLESAGGLLSPHIWRMEKRAQVCVMCMYICALYVHMVSLFYICIHVFFPCTGTSIPGSAVLVFDIHIIDFHNPSDTVEISGEKPEKCTYQAKQGDFVKYYYNATLMDGTYIGST